MLHLRTLNSSLSILDTRTGKAMAPVVLAHR